MCFNSALAHIKIILSYIMLFVFQNSFENRKTTRDDGVSSMKITA